MQKRDFDAVVVGSGPNGLAAAITLQRTGLSVLLLEGTTSLGGGLRSAECTLPGFLHDVCSAVHPLAVCSPFFNSIPLHNYGLQFIYPPFAAAHPFDDGTAGVLENSIQSTAQRLGIDDGSYVNLFTSLMHYWPDILPDLLGPLRLNHPIKMARFGYYGMQPAFYLARKKFKTLQAQSLFAGMAAHSMLPLNKPFTSAFALMLMLAAHYKGWPFAKGGSQMIANALAAHFISLGGKIETGFMVTSLNQLPSSHAILLDVTPLQLLQIAGQRLSSLYKWQLKRYRYGAGVYKIDWALSAPIPFKAPECRMAGTVHLGNSITEIAEGEQMIWKGKHPERPFVLLAQQSVFDPSRAPKGKHTAWAYCHVPNGSTLSQTEVIEKQVERFAPGFRECILARYTLNTADLENYNSNYIGGDINGGTQDITQLFTRPALRLSPYRTSAKGIYICSSSTPPGGGVHGMCGYNAARRALKDVFRIGL